MNHKRDTPLKTPDVFRTIRDYYSRQEQPSYLDIICECVVSPKTIYKILTRLEATGKLRVYRRRGLRNQYTIQQEQ